MRWRRHGDPEHGGPIVRQHETGVPCSVDDCTLPAVGRGYCERHYRRWRRYGEPLAGRVSPGGDAAQRFESYVARSAECHAWTGAVNSAGYGTFTADGVRVMAHRYAWLLSGQNLDPDLQIDHLCRNRLCVRVDQLEQVTAAENLARARAANRAV